MDLKRIRLELARTPDYFGGARVPHAALREEYGLGSQREAVSRRNVEELIRH